MGFTYHVVRVKYDSELAVSVYQRGVKKFLSKLDNFYVFHNRTRIIFSMPEVVRLAMHLNYHM